MAGAIFTANTTAECLLVASSEEVLIRLISSTNSAVKIKEWGVFFDGVSVTAEPVLVRLCLTDTSNGLHTAHTPTRRSGPAVSARTVCETMNTSSMPNIGFVLATREVHPQSGYQEKFSYGDEPIIFNGTSVAGVLSLMVNSPSSVNATAEITFEE